MIFKTFQLIIDDDNPVKSDLEKIYKYTDTSLNKSIFIEKNKIYMIEKDFIEDRFLWCYFSYDDQKYNEQVWDKEINTLKDNPKKKDRN